MDLWIEHLKTTTKARNCGGISQESKSYNSSLTECLGLCIKRGHQTWL